MKTIIAAILMVSAVASADVTTGDKPMVYRSAANVYAVAGEGKVLTNDCTVTADGMRAIVTTEHGKGFITFLDRNGEEEGQCQLAKPASGATVAKRPTVRSHARVASK